MKFSVVIPSYNREKVVLRAIDSVLKQSFNDFEIIVVDDGSIDNTKSAVTSIGDKRIKYVYQENQGATAARNTGVINAKGEFVSFLDSDDIWHEEMLAKQLEMYNSDPEIGWVYTNVQGVRADGSTFPFGLPLGIHGYCYADALRQGYIAPTTVISAKREALVDVGMFDVKLPASQDDDICFKLAKKYKVGFVPEYMASMLFDPNNRISDNGKKVAMGWWMLWSNYEEDVLKYCGIEIMQLHYLECAKRFARIKDDVLLKEALEKISDIGGHVSIKQKLYLKAILRTNGLLNRACCRILNKI